MAIVSYVQGVDEVLKNMKLAKALVGKNIEVGLKRAGLFLQRQSQKVVPIDKNVLKPSADTRSKYKGVATVVSVVYTTSYAIYVHERTELKHAPGKQAKFLEEPARTNQKRILEIIAEGKK